jgi:hypothetical protein
VLSPSPYLLDLAAQYHLVPFVILFCLIGIGSTLVMAVKAGFNWYGEIVEAYYDCRTRCDEIKQRYEQRSSKTVG